MILPRDPNLSATLAAVRAGPRCLPTPAAGRGARASLAVRRPGWCCDATCARSHSTGGAGRSPPTQWAANRAARTLVAAQRGYVARTNTRSVGASLQNHPRSRGHYTRGQHSGLPPVTTSPSSSSRQDTVRAGDSHHQSSVTHVDLFRMMRVGTFILKRPRLPSRQQRVGHQTTRATPSFGKSHFDQGSTSQKLQEMLSGKPFPIRVALAVTAAEMHDLAVG